jgi:hypothetical protein
MWQISLPQAGNGLLKKVVFLSAAVGDDSARGIGSIPDKAAYLWSVRWVCVLMHDKGQRP